MSIHTSYTEPTAPYQGNINELYQFFALRLEEMSKLGWSQEGIRKFHEYHHPHALSDKLQDSSRFFRVVYNEKKEIIGYFKSKQNGVDTQTQVVQWIMVREDCRRQWIAKKLYRAFEIWCRENNYTVAKSCTTVQNKVSQKMHEALGFDPQETENDILWFEQEVRRTEAKEE